MSWSERVVWEAAFGAEVGGIRVERGIDRVSAHGVGWASCGEMLLLRAQN